MSRRVSIAKAMAEKMKDINGENGFKSNIFNNASHKQKFWDEVHDFPSVFVVPGTETREYHPSSIIWGHLNLTVKAYVKDEEFSQELLEDLIFDIEKVVNNTRVLQYDVDNVSLTTTEILLMSITTDEGVLAPYGVADIYLQVRYPIM